MSYLELADDSL